MTARLQAMVLEIEERATPLRTCSIVRVEVAAS
jgi:hypothetical protein